MRCAYCPAEAVEGAWIVPVCGWHTLTAQRLRGELQDRWGRAIQWASAEHYRDIERAREATPEPWRLW